VKALVFDEKIVIADLPKPARKENESLIKILVAGICNTDLEIIKGYMGYKGVLGHEFVGIVEDSGDHALINKRVVGEINIGCGKCDFCLQGLSRHCQSRSVIGILAKQGVFAQYIALPDANLCLVPDSIPDEHAVFVEPLAAALEILEQVKIIPATSVAIIGDGKLALLILQVIQLLGVHCVLFGKHEDKLLIAKNLGANIESTTKNYKGVFDLVIEASGKKEGLFKALELLKPRGQLVLKSTFHGKVSLNFAGLVVDEITLIGSRCGPFAPAIRLLEKGLIRIDPLIARVFPFDDAVAAFDYAQSGHLKVLLNYK